jgi:hypothetical protein
MSEKRELVCCLPASITPLGSRCKLLLPKLLCNPWKDARSIRKKFE